MFDIVSFFPRAVMQGVPLLFGGTGEIITEKSGNLNLGIPGIMYVGGICGVIGAFMYEQSTAELNSLLAILIPVLSCLLGSLLMGLLYCFLTCSVYLGNSIEGCCSVMYLDHGKLDFALKLNAAVKTAVEIFLGGKLRRQPMGAAPDRLVAARILLENTDAPIQLLTNTAFYKNVGLTPGYMVVAMHTDDTSGVRLQNIVNSIKVRYPQMLYVNKSDDMYLLFQNIKSDAMRENVLSDIEAEASQKAVFTCGASGVFHDLKKRDAYIEQARLALEYGINHCGKNCINYFFDNFTEIILRHGCDSIFAESLIMPEFKRLIDFDEENSSDYCQSLSCYIFERCDMTKAAAKLYVHRNSLMYRIKKCEEIMDVDLSDRKTYEKLWLCCTMRSIGALPSKAE